MRILPVLAIWFATLGPASAQIILEPYATGFSLPVDIKNAGDHRLFVVEKAGRIRIIDSLGNVLPTPFLDIDPIVNSAANERGLLGLAFHPDYAQNGYFFVNYTGNDGNTRISRFQRSAADPDLADPASELNLLTVTQPFANHNAGDLAFGPDGYLYVGLGDGGSGGDPGNRAQNPLEFLGKMHRLDVDNGTPYAIPPDNPFAGSADTLPEIWALGLRNPWRISFDRMTGDFWIGDVGQDKWEEVDMEPAGSPGGRNYGWRCYEGFVPYNTNGCGPDTSYVPPVHVYENTNAVGCSITGGYVYRGSKNPSLFGKYLYTDYCTGIFWTLEPDGNGGWTNMELANLGNQEYVAFGEDTDGELYVAAIGQGAVYRITTLCTLSAQAVGGFVSCPDTCDGEILMEISGGCPPYSFVVTGGGHPPNDPWPGLAGLCAGSYEIVVTDCQGCPSTTTAQVVTPDQPPFSLELVNDTLVASEGYETYDWYMNDTLIGSTADPFWLPNVSGIYKVVGTGTDKCPRFSDEVEVEVSGLVLTGIPGLHLWPNPATDVLHLEADRPLAGLLRWFNTRGQLLDTWSLEVSAGERQAVSLPVGASGALWLQWLPADGKSAPGGLWIYRKMD